jgi:hypothetical protein
MTAKKLRSFSFFIFHKHSARFRITQTHTHNTDKQHHMTDMANIVFNLPDILSVIASKLEPMTAIYSLLGVNTLSTKIAREIRESNNLTPLIFRYIKLLDPTITIPVATGLISRDRLGLTGQHCESLRAPLRRKIDGLPISQLDTDTILAVSTTYNLTQIVAVGAASVYFNKPGSRSGIGGITIYDDVYAAYPIRIPMRYLVSPGSRAVIKIVGTRQRRFTLPLPADTIACNIVTKARQALAQLPMGDNRAGLQVYNESMPSGVHNGGRKVHNDGRYQLLYIGPQRARDFFKSRDSTITLQCTAYNVVWDDDSLWVTDNRNMTIKYCKANLIGLKLLD